MHFKNRTITPCIEENFNVFPIVSITGPRQSGKSTLIDHYIGTDIGADENWRYYSLDDRELLLRIKDDPDLFIKSIDSSIAIDEAQKAPELFHSLKLLVDKGFNKNILLSGSANFLLLQSITESLAGRAGILELLPFSLSEALELKSNNFINTIISFDKIDTLFKIVSTSFGCVTDKELLSFILYGGYPAVYNLKARQAGSLWFKNYVSTYIERDLRDLAQVGDIDTFQHVYRLLAFYSGNIMNMSAIAGNTGVSVQTIKRYISILRTSFQGTLLPAYHINQKKQITKSSKLFCFDTGLMNYFLQNSNIDNMTSCMQWGAILETHVFTQIYKEIINTVQGVFVYYWRTNNGAEVDFVIEYQDKLIPVEVKAGIQIKKQSLRGMKSFISSMNSRTRTDKRVPFGIVLYRGDNVIYLDKNILGIPLTSIY